MNIRRDYCATGSLGDIRIGRRNECAMIFLDGFERT